LDIPVVTGAVVVVVDVVVDGRGTIPDGVVAVVVVTVVDADDATGDAAEVASSCPK
jgi:hypothetical protein